MISFPSFFVGRNRVTEQTNAHTEYLQSMVQMTSIGGTQCRQHRGISWDPNLYGIG